jgi:hypothetical protein
MYLRFRNKSQVHHNPTTSPRFKKENNQVDGRTTRCLPFFPNFKHILEVRIKTWGCGGSVMYLVVVFVQTSGYSKSHHTPGLLSWTLRTYSRLRKKAKYVVVPGPRDQAKDMVAPACP